MSRAIPLESDMNWWWYRSKNNYLNHIIKSNNISKDIEILEIGPGKGNNIESLNKYGKVSVLEIEKEFIGYLYENKFVEDALIYQSFEEIDKKYDLIVLLDVLEHIRDTDLFLKNISHHLKTNGNVIISVPAYNSLWSDHDVKLKHIKRYTWSKLYEELNDFFLINKRYGMNYILLPIRFFQLRVLRASTTLNETSDLVNEFLYFIGKIENILLRMRLNPKFGISLYLICSKK
tara:strand:- start:9421 stop:10119 length:699 start_codon:yes stop_codon:yes gene_type:complete